MQVIVSKWQKLILDDGYQWYCWAYTVDHDAFRQWMKDNMEHLYQCSYRFNGGDPMYTITMVDDTDAMKFKLAFNVKE